MRIQGNCRQCGLATFVSSNSYLCQACANKNMLDATHEQSARSGPAYERTMAGREKAKRRKHPKPPG